MVWVGTVAWVRVRYYCTVSTVLALSPLYWHCNHHYTGTVTTTVPATVPVPHYCTGYCTRTPYCTGHCTVTTTVLATVLYPSLCTSPCTPPHYIPGDTFPGYHCRAYCLEVYAVNGMAAVTSVTSLVKTNAETSIFDLADLSKTRPRWKYAISPRATVKKRVTLHLLLIVAFSIFDRLKQPR